MTGVRGRGEKIRRFILERVEESPGDVAKATSARFGITRQAVNQHLRRLRAEGILRRTGNTRASTYQLAPLSQRRSTFPIEPGLAEDVVWRREVRGVLSDLPDNVLDIWQYGFTEMFNNAIEHADCTRISFQISRTAVNTRIVISDDGFGIFKKIQAAMGLLDARHSILELSKGKLTTDPAHHSGEGIFFSSRMFDHFTIISEGLCFTHVLKRAESRITEVGEEFEGTSVEMRLQNYTDRTTQNVFDEYASGDDYGFTKTVVPVRLAQYGKDKLVSRSQARRVLARLELFKIVLFDFTGVEAIGQAFADEMFRVFAMQHPEIELVPVGANAETKWMIARATRKGE